MARRRRFQNSLTAGEVGPEFLQRTDEELQNEGAQALRNVIVTNSGGVRRRPGTVPLAAVTNGTKRRAEVFDLTGDEEVVIVLSNAQVKVFDTDGTTVATLTAPWVEADIDTIQIANGDNEFYIFGDFLTQVLSVSGGTWSIANIAFETGIGSARRQPYWRFAAKGITLTPSATTGSITLTSSSAVFVAGHVGTRFRYIGNEIEITAYTNGTTVTGTVITTLYPTLTVPVASVLPFKVGHVVTGDTTGVEGQVTAVGAGDITVTLLNGYSHFSNGETLDSPEGSTTVTLAPSATTPAASTIWDEQMISDVRGYPRTGVLHRNRLILAGFPEAPNAIAASAIGFENDFDLGTAADEDAFIEGLGDDKNADIRHLVSAEQLVILTDRGCYYVPESEQSPLTPTRVDFLRISPDGSSLVRPVLTPEGVVFVDNADRILVIGTTGNVRASWSVAELSMLAQHLITGPVELTYVDGIGARSERYVLVRNTDNTVAALAYRRGAEQAGMSLWTPATGFNWKSFAAWKTQLFCLQGNFLAIFDMDATLDLQADYSASAPLLTGLSMYVARDGIVWNGPWTVNGSGNATGTGAPAAASGQTMGADFRVSVIPSPPVQAFGYERRRISAMWLDVLNTGPYRVEGELSPGYDEDDDLELPPPLQTGASEPFYLLGYNPNDMPEISQEVGEGAPFFIRSLTLEVSY